MKPIKNIGPSLCGLLLIMGAFVVISVSSAAPKKKYLRELEEAFAAKLESDQDVPENLSSSPAVVAPGNSVSKEIGAVVVFDIKQMKDAFIDLLATSELASFDELSSRVNKVDKAFQLFKAKYSADLAGSQNSTVQPLPTVMTSTPQPAPVPAPAPMTPPPSSPSPMPGDMGMGAPGMIPPPAPAPEPTQAPMTPPPSPAPMPGDMGMGAPGMMPPPPMK